MSLTINTNLSSLIVQKSLLNSTNGLNQAIERMTTGFKINHAKDNAAGYSIATNMGVKLSSYNVALDNAAMGLDVITTASDSLDLISSHLQRMRDLAEQAANGTYGEDSLNAIQSETDSRIAEINRIVANTEYNGIGLFESVSDVQVVTGNFITAVSQLSEEEALAQGYTIIKTADDLDNIRNDLSGKYILMNDIDLSSYSNWNPIGDIINAFTGEFNGNGHVIENLKISNSTEDLVGLFGVSTGIIKNLGLENVDISGIGNDSGAGAIASVASYIDNCYAQGIVEGVVAGGVVAGLMDVTVNGAGGTISNSYFVGKVAGNSYVGGLVGLSGGENQTAGKIENCFSEGSAYGGMTGGILGCSLGYTNIYNSNSKSDVTSKGPNGIAGGLAGYLFGKIENSFSTGSVTGKSNVGGLIGEGDNLILTNCYYDTISSGQTTGIGKIGTTITGNVNGVSSTELNDLIENGILNKINPIKGMNIYGQNFTIQIGIDSSDNSKITFSTEFSFANLNLDLTSADSARDALSQIDDYIKQINEKQTELGSAYNRLDSAIESIGVNIENLTSSQSTIRDADIAEESSEYIRNQILQQAAATLLATANQTPSIALQLL